MAGSFCESARTSVLQHSSCGGVQKQIVKREGSHQQTIKKARSTYSVLLGIASFSALVELRESGAEEIDEEHGRHGLVRVIESLEEVPQADGDVVVGVFGDGTAV